MDPRYCAQDVLWCSLCRDAFAPMYCNVCHTHLCKNCVEKHFSDESKVHYVVPLKQFLSTVDNSLLDVPRLITHITTKYKKLNRVSCLSDDEIWTRGEETVMRLFNIRGKLIKVVKTKSGKIPEDIAVTRSGYLMYSDYTDSSLNLVSGTHAQPLIRLQGWKPRSVCIASSGDLLVIMRSDDGKQTKVVRYSGSTEKQSYQWDDKGQPLYSSRSVYKYLCENRNLDVCVSDNAAGAVVVVDQAGNLRFTYTGHFGTIESPFRPRVRPFRPRERPFKPRGITSDSQSRILIADPSCQCIHIIDKDGQFLRYIDKLALHSPWGLCMDSKDNLYVAERYTCLVKKIQYYK
uniref:Uncharacterized protein LOC111115164 n=1 Tax=Crassostrea virginica TaxID=6565 RepID=A0A8B8C352_CRAVI|nr:uncharacterized protein LOC111115164 [Crassostrea virginica]